MSKIKPNVKRPPYTGDDVCFAMLLAAARIYCSACGVSRMTFKLGPKGWDMDVTYRKSDANKKKK